MGTIKWGVWRVGFPWVPWIQWRSGVERTGPHHPSIVYPRIPGRTQKRQRRRARSDHPQAGGRLCSQALAGWSSRRSVRSSATCTALHRCRAVWRPSLACPPRYRSHRGDRPRGPRPTQSHCSPRRSPNTHVLPAGKHAHPTHNTSPRRFDSAPPGSGTPGSRPRDAFGRGRSNRGNT